jgi:methylisocitrate lyase
MDSNPLMLGSQRKSTRLRELLQQPQPIVAPCAFDCVSARIVELAGLPVVLHGGFNSAASLFGLADVGIVTQSEMIEAARHMTQAVKIPVIADVDDGFGKPLNAARTAGEAIRAGLAGIYIEDQALPKRCPSLGGHPVVSIDEMREKLRAVRLVSKQCDPDFVVIFRTHASLAIDFEEGLRRGVTFAKDGLADLVWVDLGYDDAVIDELKAIAERITPYAPVVANMTENVGRPMLTTDELGRMGFKLIVYPLTLILTAAKSMTRVVRELVDKRTTAGITDEMMPVKEFRSIVNFEQVTEFEKRLQQRES